MVTALINWPPVFHFQWLGHIPHVRQHLPKTIVWNSPMRELIGSVMVSSPLLLAFGTLSLLLYFRLPSTFLPSKGRSITTLGARWHDFFLITLFRYFIKLFYFFHYTSYPFLKGCRLEKGHIVPVLCSHSSKKKKKKKKKFKDYLFDYHTAYYTSSAKQPLTMVRRSLRLEKTFFFFFKLIKNRKMRRNVKLVIATV